MIKKIILFFLLISVISNLKASEDPKCKCLNLLNSALLEVDTADIIDKEVYIQNIYDRLKTTSPEFKKCSDYFSLAYNMWTKGKLRVIYQTGTCSNSREFAWWIEQGPIILDMNFDLEKEIEERQLMSEFERLIDTALVSDLMIRVKKFMVSQHNGDINYLLSNFPSDYINFYGTNYLKSNILFQQQIKDSLNLKIEEQVVKRIPSLIKYGETLMSLIVVNVSYSVGKVHKMIRHEVLVISLDEGETWNLLNINYTSLNALSVIMKEIFPIELRNKLDEELSKEYPAKNGTELGEYFCECNNKIEKHDFQGLLDCMKILTKHHLWEVEKNRIQTYKYVKEYCDQHSGNIVFDGVPK